MNGRHTQFAAAVKEAEKQNHPVIAWPEDCGHVTVAELPRIDRRVAKVEFVELSEDWLRDDAKLCELRPGQAYAVGAHAINTMGDSSLVITYRPKTLAECAPERLIKAQAVYIIALENAVTAAADAFEAVTVEFVPLDAMGTQYDEIHALLETLTLAAELKNTAKATLEQVQGKGCGADTA